MKPLWWAYYAVAQLGATVFFWAPPWWYLFWTLPHRCFLLPPIGLTIAVVLCLQRAWSPADVASIKPLPNRPFVDEWLVPVNFLFGNPTDGVSGRYAYGGWEGAYNPTGSTWLAICWQCRNWLAGFNYRTWLGTPTNAPGLKLPYTLFGQRRLLQLGWTQLPQSDGWVGPYKVRMMCSP